MKLTFELVAATDINAFDKIVNEKLAAGYKFLTGQPMFITEHEDITGPGYQYSMPMLLEEEGENVS